MAAVQHAIQPPAAQLRAAVVARGGGAANIGEGLLECLRLRPASEQQVEGAFKAETLGLQEIRMAGAEGGAAVEMGGPFTTPRIGGGRSPRLPGFGGVDLVQRGEF